MNLEVTKRDGHKEPFHLSKIHRVLDWACEGITGVSVSEIELKANVQLYDNMDTDHIHELLIKGSADLISEQTPNYQFVAARLVNYKLRKHVYGQFEPTDVCSHIENNIALGVYDDDILSQFAEQE